ncbi:hypothetical protein M0802_010831 [Mischocyttarus mexicanus]|nr:hypothetical protein M0802_010831 [Mischocyttarus mexicanus]
MMVVVIVVVVVVILTPHSFQKEPKNPKTKGYSSMTEVWLKKSLFAYGCSATLEEPNHSSGSSEKGIIEPSLSFISQMVVQLECFRRCSNSTENGVCSKELIEEHCSGVGKTGGEWRRVEAQRPYSYRVVQGFVNSRPTLWYSEHTTNPKPFDDGSKPQCEKQFLD